MGENETILAWHFVNNDYTLNHDLSGKLVEPGMVLAVDPDKLDLCNYGLHASINPLDALKYAPGAVVCQVEMAGRIIQGDDKLVASQRTVIDVVDATRTLHEFAIWCAEKALALIDNPDPRSLEALRVKRLWLDKKASDKELAVAWAAASDAASVSDWNVAWAVTRDAILNVAWAVTRDAIWDAAWAAASDAAWNAARAAAWAAASDAAWDAARDAAWNAARDAQNDQLERMLLGLLAPATAPGGDEE